MPVNQLVVIPRLLYVLIIATVGTGSVQVYGIALARRQTPELVVIGKVSAAVNAQQALIDGLRHDLEEEKKANRIKDAIIWRSLSPSARAEITKELGNAHG
jgi:hypothetical protein